jgi:hypothetical protein
MTSTAPGGYVVYLLLIFYIIFVWYRLLPNIEEYCRCRIYRFYSFYERNAWFSLGFVMQFSFLINKWHVPIARVSSLFTLIY